MRFIATADLQIGMKLQWLGDNQAVFDMARLNTLATIAELVRTEDAAAVVIAGDLFDRDPVDAGDLAQTLEGIGEIGVPVLVLPGNHDSYHPTSVYRSKAFEQDRPANLTLLLDDPVTIGDVEFVGAPLRTRTPDHPVLHPVLEALDADGARRVVVGHGGVQQVIGAHEGGVAFDRDVMEAALADGRAAFIVLGDRHSTLTVGETGRIWYPGAPEPTNFRDDVGRVLVVDLPADGGEPQVEPHVTGTWRFIEETVELSSPDDVDALLARIAEIPKKPTVNLKVRATGVLPLEALQDLEQGLAKAERKFASLQRRLDGLSPLLTPDELAALPVPPYVREVLGDVTAAHLADPADAEVRAELSLLLQLLAKAAA